MAKSKQVVANRYISNAQKFPNRKIETCEQFMLFQTTSLNGTNLNNISVFPIADEEEAEKMWRMHRLPTQGQLRRLRAMS